jgi:uncharacterized protein YjbK
LQPHREIELKWAIDAQGHERLARCLCELLGPPRLLRQHNRFFDAADGRLRRQRLSLRLRLENDRLVMTCKRKRSATTTDAHDHDEWESDLDASIWKGSAPDPAVLPLPSEITTALAGTTLVELGGFRNERHEFHHQDELLCLDRVDFGVRTDHELEIETADPVATSIHWRKQMDGWKIPFRNESATKFSRLMALLGKS